MRDGGGMKTLHKSGQTETAQNGAGRTSARWSRGWAHLALLLLAVLLALPVLTPPAIAQEPIQRRNLLDYLFGGPRYEREERYKRPPPYSRRRYERDGSIIDM